MAPRHKKEMYTDLRSSKVEWAVPVGKGHYIMCIHPGSWVSMDQNTVEEIDVGGQGFLVGEGWRRERDGL